MKLLFNFGEKIDKFDFEVINEREARASAGIMMVLALISFSTVFGLFGQNTLFFTELFSITFIVEFMIRVFINPRYAPYMIIGSMMVSNQEPEWVEAKPKKFAWILGLLLGLAMAYFIVFNIMSPARALICLTCILLLMAESIFGICLGCLLYKKLSLNLEGACPGGVCETKPDKRVYFKHIVALFLSFSLFYGTYYYLSNYKYYVGDDAFENFEEDFEDAEEIESTTNTKTDKDCTVPQFAIAIGHKDKWLEHNGCK